MTKWLSAIALACAALFVYAQPAAAQQQQKAEKKGPVVVYEEEVFQDDLYLIKLPAKHERRLAQSKAVKDNDNFLAFYSDFKDEVQNKLGLQFGVDISYTAQRAAPSGKQTAIQGIYYPYATWNLFKDTRLGSGQIDFNYNLVRYWGTQAQDLNNRVEVASEINDYTTRQDLFSQASYTHTMPGDMDWLSVTLGQFPMYNFDGTNYDANQQTGLINYALSQNASSSYPLASLGAYAQATFDNISITGGYQDATNVSGSQIRFKDAFSGKYTGFGAINYNPTIDGLGAGQYGVMGYYQPSVEDQEGYSWGWSVNAEQNYGKKWSVFGRANGSTNNITAIKQSYVLGLSYLNPLDRNPLDVITIAGAYNRLSKEGLGVDYARTGETVLEAQWVWGFTKYFTITPDVQLFPKAGLNSDKEWVTVASLRTTFMF